MRRFTLLALALSMPLALAACGSDDRVTERTTTTTRSDAIPERTTTTTERTVEVED